jgi:hypothetical protein
MRGFFQSDDADHLLDEGFDLIQAATNQMVAGFQGLLVKAEEPVPKVCLKCSRQNDQGATYCRRCGMLLPVTTEVVSERRLLAVADEAPQGEAPVETTPNYIEVADARQAWHEGQLSDAKFLKTLTAVRERHLNQHEATLKHFEEAEQAGEPSDYLLQLEVLARAIESNVEALDILATALEDGYRDGVGEGMCALARATVDLLAAQKDVERSDSSAVP